MGSPQAPHTSSPTPDENRWLAEMIKLVCQKGLRLVPADMPEVSLMSPVKKTVKKPTLTVPKTKDPASVGGSSMQSVPITHSHAQGANISGVGKHINGHGGVVAPCFFHHQNWLQRTRSVLSKQQRGSGPFHRIPPMTSRKLALGVEENAINQSLL